MKHKACVVVPELMETCQQFDNLQALLSSLSGQRGVWASLPACR